MVEVLKFDTKYDFSIISIQIDFLGNCLTTPAMRTKMQLVINSITYFNQSNSHVTNFERLRAFRACTVTAQECNIALSLHANATAMSLFNLLYFRFKISQPIC